MHTTRLRNYAVLGQKLRKKSKHEAPVHSGFDAKITPFHQKINLFCFQVHFLGLTGLGLIFILSFMIINIFTHIVRMCIVRMCIVGMCIVRMCNVCTKKKLERGDYNSSPGIYIHKLRLRNSVELRYCI